MSKKRTKKNPDVSSPSKSSTRIHSGSAVFEFKLADYFFRQLLDLLDEITPVELTETNVRGQSSPGLYVLHLDGVPVYVGKAEEPLAERLGRHLKILRGCEGIELARVSFRCIHISCTWSALDYEKEVIAELKTKGDNGWNYKGFGSNEPGIRRGGTRMGEDHFFRRFPIRKDWRCVGIKRGSRSAFALLSEMKSNVPFWFKFQGFRISGAEEDGDRRTQEKARAELKGTTIDVPTDDMLAIDLLYLVGKSLPQPWQATLTATHMLLYKEVDAKYPLMTLIWPSPAPSTSSHT